MSQSKDWSKSCHHFRQPRDMGIFFTIIPVLRIVWQRGAISIPCLHSGIGWRHDTARRCWWCGSRLHWWMWCRHDHVAWNACSTISQATPPMLLNAISSWQEDVDDVVVDCIDGCDVGMTMLHGMHAAPSARQHLQCCWMSFPHGWHGKFVSTNLQLIVWYRLLILHWKNIHVQMHLSPKQTSSNTMHVIHNVYHVSRM